MTFAKICLLPLFFVFLSCSGQTKKSTTDWKTIGSNNQRTAYIDNTIMEKEPKITTKITAVYYPVVANGVAYFNNNAGKLSAFDIEKEVELWNIDIDFAFNHLAVDNNVIYIAGYKTDAGTFYIAAVDMLTQKKIWQIEEKMRLISGITVEDGKVYVSGHLLSTYDSKTGQLLWEFKPEKTTETGVPYLSIPAITNGLLYIGGIRTNFYAINVNTGEKVWSYNTAIVRHPVFASNKVIITTENGHLNALDAIKGNKIWTYETTESQGSASAPVIANGEIYFASRGTSTGALFNILAVDLETGTKKWIRDISGWSVSNLTTMGNMLAFIITDRSSNNYSGTLYALDRDSGKDLWKVPTNPTTALNPLVATGSAILYTGEEGPFGDAKTNLYILK